MRRTGSDVNARLAGFSLLEVLAAVAIVGGVIVGVLAARQRAQASCLAAHRVTTSTRLCHSVIARLRAGQVGEGEGVFDGPGGWRWRIGRGPMQGGMPEALAAYRVEVLSPDDDTAGCAATVWMHRSLREEGVR